jgi:hypothetical protein
MGFLGFLEEISPTVLGIVIGSFFTVIGVILTNASNTKRLRLQHEHEQRLESKERDLKMRRETYMAAMEAISAGMTAVGKFAELSLSEQELWQPYFEKSPAIGKVLIVGRNDTIKAMANFSSELTGTFLRLSAKRSSLDVIWKRYSALEENIQTASREQDRLQTIMDEYRAENVEDEEKWDYVKLKYQVEQQKIDRLTTEQEAMQFTPALMGLIQKSMDEIKKLDHMLPGLIKLMREELELPFDEENYRKILEETYKRQAEYFQSFVTEVGETTGSENDPED